MSPGGPLARYRRRHGRLKRLFYMGSHPEIACYDVATAAWHGAPLSIALLTDLHVVNPWTPLDALRRIVDEINEMPVDLVLLLGDFIAARWTPGLRADPEEIAGVLALLEAPLGVHAILGNHDWKDDPEAQANGYRATSVNRALLAAGLAPLTNTATRLEHGSGEIWLVGLDSQRGHLPIHRGGERHDPAAAFADVPDGACAILLAHEPDYFSRGDPRPTLQVSGHTHGGQANLFGWRPFTPSSHRDRYAYGHIVENGRHLVVSGGIGYTWLPLRISQPPEITLVRLTGGPTPEDHREEP